MPDRLSLKIHDLFWGQRASKVALLPVLIGLRLSEELMHWKCSAMGLPVVFKRYAWHSSLWFLPHAITFVTDAHVVTSPCILPYLFIQAVLLAMIVTDVKPSIPYLNLRACLWVWSSLSLSLCSEKDLEYGKATNKQKSYIKDLKLASNMAQIITHCFHLNPVF